MAEQVREAVRLGREQHRGDADLLPAAGPASQTPEVDQHARKTQRRDQEAHARGAHLPERGELSAAGACPRGGDARELDRGDSLPEHGVAQRTQKDSARGRVGEGTGLWEVWKTLRVFHTSHSPRYRNEAKELKRDSEGNLQNLTYTTVRGRGLRVRGRGLRV